MKLLNYSAAFGSLVLAFYLLHIGQSILIPLVVAIVFWYLISSLTHEFQKIKIRGEKLPYWLGMILAVIACSAAAYLFFNLTSSNINEIVEAAPVYQSKLETLINHTYRYLGFQPPESIDQALEHLDLASVASYFASAITSLAGYISLILIYVIFLLLEYRSFDEKLALIIKDKKKFKEVHNVFTRINRDIHEYLKIKTFLSILTAVLSYAVLKLIGVDFAAFWATLIFLLNYIPNIGSIIAVLFPMLLTLIQFDSPYPFIISAIFLPLIQFIIGNIIEPKMMGHTLNLSPFIILLSLALWGTIWGIIGLFLCVPIMVIINIILARFPQTRWLAIMMSEDGQV